MARYDGRLTAAGETAIDAAELLAALGAQAAVSPDERKQAIVRYLSASEGWDDALTVLRGAFADEHGSGAQRLHGLREGKEG